MAPALREVRTTMVPDCFGGNMDTPEMRAGATCYLRVNVEGALLSLGDGHYHQSEGETCGWAVEGAMSSVVIVELVKGGRPAWPRIENDTHLMVVGSGRPLDAAWRAAHTDMVGWLSHLQGLGRLDAYQLLSQVAESPRPTWWTPTSARWPSSTSDFCPKHPPMAILTRTCADELPSWAR